RPISEIFGGEILQEGIAAQDLLARDAGSAIGIGDDSRRIGAFGGRENGRGAARAGKMRKIERTRGRRQTSLRENRDVLLDVAARHETRQLWIFAERQYLLFLQTRRDIGTMPLNEIEPSALDELRGPRRRGMRIFGFGVPLRLANDDPIGELFRWDLPLRRRVGRNLPILRPDRKAHNQRRKKQERRNAKAPTAG